MLLSDPHSYFMTEALKEAKKAYELDEIPVGAVIVSGNRIIARAHNQVQTLQDVTAHAEMIAITAGSNFLGSKYLNDCAIYITVEPCLMCATALFWSKISGIYYGASDNQYGFTQLQKKIFTGKVVVKGGFMHEECRYLIDSFFKNKRDLQDLI
jgi:tRNA(adenine34) deaminase